MIAAALFGACGESRPEPPPPDPGPTEGVFGRAPAAVGGVPSVVMLVGDAAIPEAASAEERPVMDQFGLSFSPRAMIVPVGEAVVFQNSEADLAHNVHLRALDSDSTVFSADATAGETLEVVLERRGGYDVLCDMHPGMTAFIFATDVPYTVLADADGFFHLSGVAPGEYAVFAWSADPALRTEASVTVGSGPVEVILTTRAP